MTETSNQNAIESKKTSNTSTTTESSANYPAFLKAVMQNIISVLISFVIVGSIGLYTCKVAQANILPDNMKYAPFGSKQKEVEQIAININIIKKYGFFGFGFWETPEKVSSTKVFFDNDKITQSYEKGLIGLLNSLKENPERANFFGLYIRDILVNILSNNNWVINKVFGFCNQYMPESLIILLFPMVAPFLCIIFLFLNFGLTGFYQIKYWSDFFMDMEVDNKDKSRVVWYDPFTYFRPIRAFFFFLYIVFLFIPMLFILPFLTTVYASLSPLSIPCKVIDTNQIITFIQFMKENLLYKSQLYLILFSFGLLSPASNYLGSYGLIACMIAVLVVFFGFHLYNQYIPSEEKGRTTGIVSTEQAKGKDTSKMKGGKKHK